MFKREPLSIFAFLKEIRLYDNGIKQAKSLEASEYLIESKLRMKGQLVDELKDLLSEIDMDADLKTEA
jgi:hypothetical protein